MTNEEIFSQYKELVKFLSQILGPSAEIVLHDVSKGKNSIIAIEHGYHSNRTIGDPLTNLAKDIISSQEYLNQPFKSNYSGISKGKKFTSSTFYIMNKKELIGLLCINRDMTLFNELNHLIGRLQKQHNLVEPRTSQEIEALEVPVDEYLEELISAAIENSGIHPSQMNMQERIKIVHTLKCQGALTMKGAIPALAIKLGVSEPTIYRYASSSVEN
ncbi:PAS domain-containing protein [Aerococcaceae bacterium zg-B36]|uniref:helix-turn-helix transcriptional regulator n=1 Tax=Aerococcaceae bacterium zg-252 TaxID=2796928 RepID=UPI001BD88C9C|nr:PAS domain-containing protein [Aerococcaceae bacterium zg-B36]